MEPAFCDTVAFQEKQWRDQARRAEQEMEPDFPISRAEDSIIEAGFWSDLPPPGIPKEK